MNEKVKQVLAGIVDTFKSGKIPDAVALASFPVPDIPSTKWSFMNRTIMFLSGSIDARGFRQWKEADRWVKKGSKAIHILVPCFKKAKDEDTGDEKDVLYYFKASPVFRYEDTDGKELDYQQIELPELPLRERAENWGIEVKAIPGNYRFRGYYSQDKSLIALATPEEKTFFHELAHAAHGKVKGGLTQRTGPVTGNHSGTLSPSVMSDGRKKRQGHDRQLLSVYRKVCQRHRPVRAQCLPESPERNREGTKPDIERRAT